MKPQIWCRPTAARPADAMQPQFSQSGAPPNWHGVIFVVKSAEIVVVVLRLQAVDRDDDRQTRDAAPLGGNLADRAGDELHVDAALREERQNRRQLTIPHERFSADDGDMEWAL